MEGSNHVGRPEVLGSRRGRSSHRESWWCRYRDSTISTHAVGSCIAVCVFDPVAGVAGMLHYLLPESSINPRRAVEHPGVFADTGIPLLFQRAYGYGLVKQRAIVKLIGGAEMPHNTKGWFNTGHRNCWRSGDVVRNGVFVTEEEVGTATGPGHAVGSGRLQVSAALAQGLYHANSDCG